VTSGVEGIENMWKNWYSLIPYKMVLSKMEDHSIFAAFAPMNS
jgi:hypothetical protein